jgi:gluconolactonase
MAAIAATRLHLVVETDAHEGPVYVADEDALYFTTVPWPGQDGPRVDIRRLAFDGLRFPLGPERLSTVRADANAANGMALALDGRLLVCEQGSMTRPAAITLVDRATGETETLVDAWRGRPLGSPNDVVGNSNGTVWFTDPSYGHLQGFRPPPALRDRVYRYDPATRDLAVVADGFDKPNGLVFSPDERTLYVNDSGVNQEPGSFHPERPHHIRALDLETGDDRVFAEIEPGQPDGMKVATDGRVFCSCAAGVQIFDPSGERVGLIPVEGAVNFAFGPDGVLYITDDSAIWAAKGA